MMHDYINRRAKYVLDGCSMSSGTLFQFSWNHVPTNLEQESILAVTRLELKSSLQELIGWGMRNGVQRYKW
ncbi:hypothetical protein HMPREF1991_01652 [Hoylesella loescheii DSM 19665 = JCM 12249 = ATCC 15930]|uniref:Uncharacterized protein n=1 Tax=Hoylesella loescheii DSM 19665 = JCM 12249 = ATCC 15930 TaxID=1122985 RepID=A0A069QHR7_HOYLO|nr:hypothetical protein HMPREF1991_01652 [Hoylesella loescheii DSM 19665 = JCM 12249 = ATCC 15930]